MKTLTWVIALGIGWGSFGLVPETAHATPDPSARVARAESDGWDRTPRSLTAGKLERREGGKRSAGRGAPGRIERVPAPPGRGSDPSIPEPSAALLFGAGILVVRSFARATSPR